MSGGSREAQVFNSAAPVNQVGSGLQAGLAGSLSLPAAFAAEIAGLGSIISSEFAPVELSPVAAGAGAVADADRIASRLSRRARDIEKFSKFVIVDALSPDCFMPKGEFYSSEHGAGYYVLRRSKVAGQNLKGSSSGWKFHIAVAQTRENIQKAYEIMCPILIANDISTTKFVVGEFSGGEHGEQVLSYAKYQPGKAICIYACNAPEDVIWSAVLSEIEAKLLESGVVPDIGAPHWRYRDAANEVHFSNVEEAKICGSQFIFYENDSFIFNSEDEIIAARDAGRLENPAFGDINIAPALAVPESSSDSDDDSFVLPAAKRARFAGSGSDSPTP